jgi:cytidylate kinase
METPSVIAIDGPAGSGKSTLGALLAERLGYLYFDTGVMYRALTLAAMRNKLDLDDAEALEALAGAIDISIHPLADVVSGQSRICIDGEDVSSAIRQPEVEQRVSHVARHPGVRREMVRQQRAVGLRGNVVMVGRDIGTIVMPDAGLKLFLDAALAERASRRARDQAQRGLDRSQAEVEADLARRDGLDRHVLQPAADAVVLYTDDLSPAQEVEWVLDYLRRAQHEKGLPS